MMRPEQMVGRADEAERVAQAEHAAPDLRRLVEAALDQPRPSKRLAKMLNRVLVQMEHPAAPRSR